MLRKFLLVERRIGLELINSLEPEEEDIVLELSGNEILLKELVKLCRKVVVLEDSFGRISKLESEFASLDKIEFIHSNFLSIGRFEFNKLISGFLIDRQEILENVLISLNKKRKEFPRVRASILVSSRLYKLLTSEPYDIEYCFLSFLRSYLLEIRKSEKVPRNHFLPRPGYDGFFISMEPKEIEADEKCLKIAKIIFLNRNQTLQRSLLKSRGLLGIGKKELKRVLEERLPKFLSMKVFELDTQDILEICKRLGDVIDKKS